ncbi:hypothetical protein QUF90_04150, partial [Desulfococcaceae bacterium HSG9]|nr:hypothetical protein [Desulfococcaceae bacterium HSG9]
MQNISFIVFPNSELVCIVLIESVDINLPNCRYFTPPYHLIRYRTVEKQPLHQEQRVIKFFLIPE